MRLKTSSTLDFTSGAIKPITSQELTGYAKSTKLRVVCEPCNNVWMSAIEEAVKPTLTAMIRGETISLGAHEQYVLSQWLSLKVLIFDASTTRAVADRCIRTAFMNTARPLEGMTVWTAHCLAIGMQSAIFRESGAVSNQPAETIGSDAPHNMQVISFGVGNVFFHIHHNTGPASINAYFNPRGRYFQIWPIVDDLVMWPPIWSISASEATEVSRFISKFSALRRGR
jgi:hypothetical protein